MKNKTNNSKIEALGRRIESIKSKAENAKILKESGTFQTLESDLEAIIIIQNDVQKLKDLLHSFRIFNNFHHRIVYCLI